MVLITYEIIVNSYIFFKVILQQPCFSEVIH